MFWNALWSELRARFRRPPLACGCLGTLMLTIIFVVVFATSNVGSWTKAFIFQFVVLPLSLAAMCFVCAWHWLRTQPPQPEPARCQTCGFSLAGHEQPPARCPECGSDPTAQSSSQDNARAVVLGMGCLVISVAVLLAIHALAALSLGRRTA